MISQSREPLGAMELDIPWIFGHPPFQGGRWMKALRIGAALAGLALFGSSAPTLALEETPRCTRAFIEKVRDDLTTQLPKGYRFHAYRHLATNDPRRRNPTTSIQVPNRRGEDYVVILSDRNNGLSRMRAQVRGTQLTNEQPYETMMKIPNGPAFGSAVTVDFRMLFSSSDPTPYCGVAVIGTTLPIERTRR
jgi:hypothetical protein